MTTHLISFTIGCMAGAMAITAAKTLTLPALGVLGVVATVVYFTKKKRKQA